MISSLRRFTGTTNRLFTRPKKLFHYLAGSKINFARYIHLSIGIREPFIDSDSRDNFIRYMTLGIVLVFGRIMFDRFNAGALDLEYVLVVVVTDCLSYGTMLSFFI